MLTTVTKKMQATTRVAVIGSGSGGLVVCHRLTSSSLEVTVFEQTNTVGGTWVYDERTEENLDAHIPIHTSMYRNLRTNLPKESMSFLDYPFPSGGPSFIRHEEVLRYLNDYCDHFQLRNYIRFKTEVKRVEPVNLNGKLIWKILVKDLESECEEEQEFDAIAVCNGHYSVPRYPDLPGLNSFEGTVIHSHNYRVPEPYSDKIVACLGGGPSGYDIAMEMRSVAKKVFLCQNGKFPFKYPPDLHLKPFPKSCSGNQLVFEDEDESEDPCLVDAIILCTGYDYVYPFLAEDCSVKVKDNCVMPLYKQLLNTKYPTMAFFGVQRAIIPFPLMDIQAQVFRKVLEGTISLPSTIEMDEEVERDLREALESGKPLKHFHKMGPEVMQIHLDELTEWAQLTTPVPKYVHKLFLYLKTTIKELETFRNINYDITEDDDFVIRA